MYSVLNYLQFVRVVGIEMSEKVLNLMVEVNNMVYHDFTIISVAIKLN